MQYKDAEFGLALHAKLLPGSLDVLLQLLDGVFEGGSCVIDLVDDEDLLADQVLHLAQAGEVQPLCPSHNLARLLDNIVGSQLLVQGKTNGLDRNVGVAGFLEEGAEDTCRYVTATADSDHKLGLEVCEDVLGGLFAEVVHLDARQNGQPDTFIVAARK